MEKECSTARQQPTSRLTRSYYKFTESQTLTLTSIRIESAMYEIIEEMAESHGVSNAEIMRRLLHKGCRQQVKYRGGENE
jgi:predicted DNA-binding ribbon-helix-helix protein